MVRVSPSATAVCSASLAPIRNSPAKHKRPPVRTRFETQQNLRAPPTDTTCFREKCRPNVAATPPTGRRDDRPVLSGSVNAPLPGTNRAFPDYWRNVAENGLEEGRVGLSVTCSPEKQMAGHKARPL